MKLTEEPNFVEIWDCIIPRMKGHGNGTMYSKMACSSVPSRDHKASVITPDVHRQRFLSRRLKFDMKANRCLALLHHAETDRRILDPDGYKDRVRQMWHKRAPNYDFQNNFHPQLCEQLVAIARIKPGKANLLDVASGTGTAALSAARALGPEGIVTAVDVSEAMLAKVIFTVASELPSEHCFPCLSLHDDLMMGVTDLAELTAALTPYLSELPLLSMAA